MKKTKPSVAIVGAGLGGCMTAHFLADYFDVAVIEPQWDSRFLERRIFDCGRTVGGGNSASGLGGSTQLWHNALVEINHKIIERNWPISAQEIESANHRVFPLLSGIELSSARNAIANQKDAMCEFGFHPELLTSGMYIPSSRRNLWSSLKLSERVLHVDAEAVGCELKNERCLNRLVVRDRNGAVQKLKFDAAVLSCGGIGTPALLLKMAERGEIPPQYSAGCYYHDHPFAYVGEVTLNRSIHEFWNASLPGGSDKGRIRLPFVFNTNGLEVSFQLRPSYLFNPKRTKLVGSGITRLRNNPFDVSAFLSVFLNIDDILDILSFKFGLRSPTKHYSVLMVAEEPSSPSRVVNCDHSNTTIQRDWRLSSEYLTILDEAIGLFVKSIEAECSNYAIHPNWQTGLTSSAHFSGTARMGLNPVTSVCGPDGRIHGMENLYVSDGSILPRTGYANSGLAIAANAARIAETLKQQV